MISPLSIAKIDSLHTSSKIFQALITTASQLNYPIAIWKLPNEIGWHCMASDQLLEIENFEIEQAGAGFLINKFENPGLTNVSFLRADLYFSSNSQEFVNLRPDANDNFLNQFQKRLSYNLNIVDDTNPNPLQIIQFEEEPQNDYKQNVESAIEAINGGKFLKIVLARKKTIALQPNFDYQKTFEKLSELYPNTFVSIIFIPGSGIWMGASPEILISSKNNIFKTSALAGTQSAAGHENLREVLWSQKEIEEQVFVNRYIINCFKRIRLRDYDEEGPKTVRAGNLLHLRTDLIVDMQVVDFPQLATTMVDLLHPTSAVCGMPHKEAFDFITGHENFNRELYAGYLGPININNASYLFVNLRCMKVEGNRATLYAGAGITQDSKPEKEWLETEMKFKTLLDVIIQ